MIPKKLSEGDEIRIVSPARSLSLISAENRRIATARFEEMGFKVTFSANAQQSDEFTSSSIRSRVEDLHQAFADTKVKAIFTTIGGFNSNQLLQYLDYDLIRQNPKILCGYSDITALSNAIYRKSGLVTYYGPHFSTMAMVKGLNYTQEYLKKCLIDEEPFEIHPALAWSDDPWYIDQEKRKFVKNKGFLTINEGKAKGTIIGGNLCTLNLLQGTKFMPSLKEAILFLEDDEMAKEYCAQDLDRNLQSILHLPHSEGIRGIVLGRFQKASQMTTEKLIRIIKTKEELQRVPVIAEVDFGHTTPQITFPIGGKALIHVKQGKVQLKILTH